MFAMLFGGAVYYRKKPAAHKSLMLLTAINFVPPALARIPIAPLLNLGAGVVLRVSHARDPDLPRESIGAGEGGSTPCSSRVQCC
jgi:hypothetical protein